MHADRVHFGYREGVDVLRKVTLEVAPGTRMALVGPSGAGKSTLGRLLAGIYAPRTGRITLGGAELSRMPAEEVRSHVALVNQEHHVFVGSLRDNLLLARTDADDAELWAALGAVDADGWGRALDEGLDTEVGSADRAQRRRRPSRSRWPGWSWPTRTRWSWTRRPRSSTRARPAIWSGPWPGSWTAVRSWPSPTGCTPPTTRT